MENDLIFTGENPVVLHSYGSSDDIYMPIKCTSCDINIVNKEILDDLYTPYKDDIMVVVRRLNQIYETETNITDPGSVGVEEITPAPDSILYHTIYQRDAFYEDIDGVFRFKGILENTNGRWPVNLYYDYDDKDWGSGFNTWGLKVNGNGINEQYFHDGTNSYRVDWDGTSHYISTWDAETSTWTDRRAYHKIEGSTISDMAYGCNQIYHMIDGTMELLFGTNRYGWDSNWKRWYKKTNYRMSDGSSYYATYGEWYIRIKNRDGSLVDAVVVNGTNGEDWIAEIDSTGNYLFKMVKLQSSYDIGNIFTDENGNLYCIESSGKLLYWSWESDLWYEWITFSGSGYQANTFGLDYVVPGNGTTDTRRVVIRFMDTGGEYKGIYLHNFHPPVVTIKRTPTGEWDEPGSGEQWMGYVMPNTYSQPVTQNLDSITITAIDYLSVLKYVTIDMLFEKPNIRTFGEIICAAIAYVFASVQRGCPWTEYRYLYVEESVSYGGTYDGTNGLMDMKCQVSNFWDESGKAATAYDVISELLKPFCMQLSFNSEHGYLIHNVNNMQPYNGRDAAIYYINQDGTFERGGEYPETVRTYDENRWLSNNVSDATIEIDTTFNKVTGVASTAVPSWSKMAIDLVDYNNRDMYDAYGLNVETNKTRGYVKETRTITIRPGYSHPVTVVESDLDPHWFYLWNGTYVNSDYDLESWNEYVNWYLNCNQLYQYLNNSSTPESDYGSILNFFGGAANPTGEGKTQAQEKGVQINKVITAYAPDNGTPPELLEKTDLEWSYSYGHGTPLLTKYNDTNAKFGSGIVMTELRDTRKVYHQTYENIVLNSSQDNVLDFSLSQSYSRTGLDVNVKVMSNNTAINKVFGGAPSTLISCDSYFFPSWWNAENVVVDSYYFRRYKAGSGGTSTCRPVWDETMVKMYVKLSDDTYLQFNGKDWVADDGEHSHPFYLSKMMTKEKLFHNSHRYNVIRSSADQTTIRYSLTGDDIYIYYDNDGGVVDEETESFTRCKPYNSEENALYSWIANCGEGQLSIKLPFVDDPSATVYVDVYSSTMLGMTGSDETVGSVAEHTCPFYWTTDSEDPSRNFKEAQVYINFLPKNVSHVKAEHLDLKISITVPESNLGQMFSQSDIEYSIKSNMNDLEEYSGPSFQVNTVHPLVASSFSYIMFGNGYADPDEFIINGVSARPECYTVQAYFNWLTRIRKIYSKTFILPLVLNEYYVSDNVINEQAFMYSPEIGENKMMIISDDFDYKTYRHSVVAVECENMQVDYVDQYIVNELPHKARAERWNLPTANKN